jgi:hypothetical protein
MIAISNFLNYGRFIRNTEPPPMSPTAAITLKTATRPFPLYLAECSYGRYGNAFRETDRDRNSRHEIVALIRSGEIEVIKVIEIDEIAGTCCDVTDEIVSEAMMQEAA